tara:strand:+ start:12074 stop:13357 length:1284 start_codon:yes stop_codon:yes gene_type:complete
MARPTLTPASTTSTVVLPVTGALTNVSSLPFGVYSDSSSPLFSQYFATGAIDQVAYTYKKLGGDVLDLEITEGQVYAAYEEATLEYSYIVNIHQAKNTLPSSLGNTTGTFDHDGHLQSGTLSGSLSGSHVGLKYPRYEFSYARRVGEKFSAEAGQGGYLPEYSASFSTSANVQDYDLQSIIETASEAGSVPFANKVGNTKVRIKKVFYKTPQSMWRFYGYYGGLNVVGNLSSYGQFSDDSTFQLVPTWQSKAQGMAFEDALNVRLSKFSYEIKNNKLRLFPEPAAFGPTTMWVQFTIPTDSWGDDDDDAVGLDGVNNLNTLPFGNVPYENINAIGKQWIRRFCLALTKEMLGQVRSKFATLPIPGESVTLNGSALISEGKEEQDKLREELKSTLDELTYVKLVETNSVLVDGVTKIQTKSPNPIFTG